MVFYYPIPAGATVICKYCGARLREHLDDDSGWRGCLPGEGNKEGDMEMEATAHPVWLVSAERRTGVDRRGGGGEALHNGNGHQERRWTPPMVPRLSLAPIAAGPRAAVYMVTPGARLSGQTGQAARVFQLIAGQPEAGKTAAELRKELKLKAKSLESVLYRLKLAGLIRAYNLSDVRQGV